MLVVDAQSPVRQLRRIAKCPPGAPALRSVGCGLAWCLLAMAGAVWDYVRRAGRQRRPRESTRGSTVSEQKAEQIRGFRGDASGQHERGELQQAYVSWSGRCASSPICRVPLASAARDVTELGSGAAGRVREGGEDAKCCRRRVCPSRLDEPLGLSGLRLVLSWKVSQVDLEARRPRIPVLKRGARSHDAVERGGFARLDQGRAKSWVSRRGAERGGSLAKLLGQLEKQAQRSWPRCPPIWPAKWLADLPLRRTAISPFTGKSATSTCGYRHRRAGSARPSSAPARGSRRSPSARARTARQQTVIVGPRLRGQDVLRPQRRGLRQGRVKQVDARPEDRSSVGQHRTQHRAAPPLRGAT